MIYFITSAPMLKIPDFLKDYFGHINTSLFNSNSAFGGSAVDLGINNSMEKLNRGYHLMDFRIRIKLLKSIIMKSWILKIHLNLKTSLKCHTSLLKKLGCIM